MDRSALKSPTGFSSTEIAIFTASQGSGKSVMKALDLKNVYYIMSEHQSDFPHPVYKTDCTTEQVSFVNHRLRLMMLSNIVFSVTDGKIELIKHRYCNCNPTTHILSEEELKQYRWYMLQAVDI